MILPTRVFLLNFVLLCAFSVAQGQTPTLNFAASAGRRAESVEKKRVERKQWGGQQTSSFAEKSFPITEWGKHFSSVGSKRAAISVSDGKEKQLYKTTKIENEAVSLEMSQWNARMKDLHKKAGITMDEKARIASDQKLYSAMLQDSKQFKEMAEEVSLRDLNRYQFRRNRPEGAVPVTEAGAEKSKN